MHRIAIVCLLQEVCADLYAEREANYSDDTDTETVVWAYEGNPGKSPINSCFLATARLLASVGILASVLVALSLPLLVGLVVGWLLILLLMLRRAGVALFVV